ncbi:MAG: TRAP transporter small permease [Maledivibacter sp.]|jgi:TRAP-type C4-dicarboxylate transport system permease small subunit|nr:TRAP transporter small permease [Maledivibacter sp.]
MEKRIGKVIEIISNKTGILFFSIIILTLMQVFFRFIMDRPLVWSEELARFLLIWMTFIGVSVNAYNEKLLSVTSLVDILPRKVRFWLYICRQIIASVFLLTVIFSSYDLIRVSMNFTSGAMDIPLGYWRGAPAVGCMLIQIFIILRMVLNFRLYKKGLYPLNVNEDWSDL